MHLLNFVNGRCVPWNETALVVVIAWNRTGPKPLFKPMVTQFTDSHMVKNKSKNKKILFKFGTVKNNKQQFLFPISVSHRPSHNYIPGAMQLRRPKIVTSPPTTSSRWHRKLPLREPTVPQMTTKAVKPTTHSLHWNSKPVINEYNKGSVFIFCYLSWKRLAMEAFAHYRPFVMGIPGNTLILSSPDIPRCISPSIPVCGQAGDFLLASAPPDACCQVCGANLTLKLGCFSESRLSWLVCPRRPG